MGPRFREDDDGVFVGTLRKFLSTDSNSQAFAFSRRKASEVCQSLANRARGWSGGRRQDACEAPLEAGLIDPPRAARHRARPRLGAAPPSAPPTTGRRPFRG